MEQQIQRDNHYLLIKMDGFTGEDETEIQKARDLFRNRLLEEKLVPLRKQIRLDLNVDYVFFFIEQDEGNFLKFSLVQNMAEDYFFQEDDALYQAIERREGAVGDIYDILQDVSKVRMRYLHRPDFDKCRAKISTRWSTESLADPAKIRTFYRKVRKPTPHEIQVSIALAATRFRDEIDAFSEEYFNGESERPQVVKILGMPIEEFDGLFR